MKQNPSIFMLVFLSLVLMSDSLIMPAQANADTASWQQKGFNMFPQSSEDFSSNGTKQSLNKLKADNVNSVALVIPYTEASITSVSLYPASNTPSDDSLVQAIQYAHSIGLKVMLKPHLELPDGNWRANINPSDRNAWFAGYTTFLDHYAALAQANNVDDFCIGTELIGMTSPDSNSTNTQHWLSLISHLRTEYSGKMTYSANWVNELDKIQFWGSLDYIGVSAYYTMTNTDGSVQQLSNYWNIWDKAYISPVAQKYNKQVVFTEIGYRSIDRSYEDPSNWQINGSYNEDAQANAYAALYDYWGSKSYFGGVDWWYWSTDPNAGGAGNTDYIVQNKKAELVVRDNFAGGSSSDPTSNSGGSSPISFNTSVSPNPTVGQSVSINTAVSTAESLDGVIVDVEVRDSSEGKIFQHYFEQQHVATDQPASYNVVYTPSSAGMYHISVGVFSAGWQTALNWNENTAAFTVSATTATTSVSDNFVSLTRINLPFPQNNSHIANSILLKANIPNVAMSKYDLFWQVDGGVLSPMVISTQGILHQESVLEVSKWTSNGSGPYRIGVLAKNKSGLIISKQAVNIYVDH